MSQEGYRGDGVQSSFIKASCRAIWKKSRKLAWMNRTQDMNEWSVGLDSP
jgi:hypothetical protein